MLTGIETGDKFSERLSLFAKHNLGLDKASHVIIGLRKDAIDEVIKILNKETDRVPEYRERIKDLAIYISNNRTGINAKIHKRNKLASILKNV